MERTYTIMETTRTGPLLFRLAEAMEALLDVRVGVPPDTPAAGLLDTGLSHLERAWDRAIAPEPDPVALAQSLHAARRVTLELSRFPHLPDSNRIRTALSAAWSGSAGKRGPSGRAAAPAPPPLAGAVGLGAAVPHGTLA